MKTTRLKIIQGPHLLFVGANWNKTYGITVEHLAPSEEVEKQGLRRQFEVNDFYVRKSQDWCKEELGLSDEQYQAIANELQKMTQEQLGTL